MRPVVEAKRRHKCRTDLQDKLIKEALLILTPPINAEYIEPALRITRLVDKLAMICEDYVDQEVQDRYDEEFANGWLTASSER